MKTNSKQIGTIALILALTGCAQQNKTSIPLVQTQEVSVDNGGGTAEYPGRSESDRSSSVAFRVSGTISEVYVRPGQYVEMGAPLAQLDTRDYDIQLQATQAEYDQVKAEVMRVTAMYSDNAVSENDYDKARYGLVQMEQKLQHHRSQLEDCTLRAPFNGYVDDILFHRGETVLQGIPVISFFDRSDIEIVVNISAADYRRKDDIESISASFAVLPDQEFPLVYKSVSNMANANQLYELHLSINGYSSEITPGMAAMVRFNFLKDEDSEQVCVPLNALFEKDGESLAFLYDPEDECIHATPVEIIKLTSDGNAIITGLYGGDEIVTAGISKLNDGQKVRTVTKASESNPGGLL